MFDHCHERASVARDVVGAEGVFDAADLKKNYESAASKKLREMTDGKLRLGFSPLD